MTLDIAMTFQTWHKVMIHDRKIGKIDLIKIKNFDLLKEMLGVWDDKSHHQAKLSDKWLIQNMQMMLKTL